MPGLWLCLDSGGRTALVAGGGRVATRKAAALTASGVRVLLVAPDVSDDIRRLERDGLLSVHVRKVTASDLDGCFLVVAATNDPEANREIAAEGHRRGLLVNVADDPGRGNCRFPALLRRGNLEVAVSTGGRCPGFAPLVRDRIGEIIGEEFAAVLETLARERDKLLTEGQDSTYNSQILRTRMEELLGRLATHKDHVP